ncbi:MAG: DNA repair protein RadA, partial [Candidatus Dependentiae bacterium]|nr:DNA repair protein RadA [Candidatus Dependentiae bacterium]
GCCPECRKWNTLEEVSHLSSQPKTSTPGKTTKLQSLDEISTQEQARFTTNISEWDRVTGNGIVPGSFSIVTGDPGIGKSTLLLQVCSELAQQHKVFYFSTEESLSQVKLRFQRLKNGSNKLLFSTQATLEIIVETCKQEKPDIVIIDSIQNIYSSENFSLPGTITQLRETAFYLMKLAKDNNIAIIVTGHITKEGQMAGPKILEHIVDAVFYLQKEDKWQTRILRSEKNRFGSINEIGFFQMTSEGMIAIENINQHLIDDTKHTPGSVIISSLEGTRPVFLELQALCIQTQFSVAQRVATGIDHKQIVLIAAILEKYLHIKFSGCDIFFKLSGGIKIKDNSADLGIALTLLSSYFQKPVPAKTIALGEVSLTGLIKPIQNIDIHAKEASKFGFDNLLIAHDQKLEAKGTKHIRRFKSVYDLLQLFPE